MPSPLPTVEKSWGRSLPARLVLAPVDAGEELLLVSPASDVRLEWKAGVGRFNLLPVDGITLKKIKRSYLLGEIVDRIPLYKVYLSPPNFLKN